MLMVLRSWKMREHWIIDECVYLKAKKVLDYISIRSTHISDNE